MDNALNSIKVFFVLVSIFLALVFSFFSTIINHINGNRILLDSFSLAANNTAKSIAYPLKIGDLNIAQARVNDLSSVVHSEKIIVLDAFEKEVFTVPAFVSEDTSSCANQSIRSSIIYAGASLGTIVVCYKELAFSVKNIDLSTVSWFFILFGILFLLLYKLVESRFSEIKILFNYVSTLNPDDEVQISEKGLRRVENLILVRSINAMISRIKSYENDLEKLRVSEQLANLAVQVSHDIRSPLSALNLVSDTLLDVSEEKRILIRHSVQRINDIANDLLSRGKRSEQSCPDEKAGKNTLNCLLAVEVDSIVSEKRLEYRNCSWVDIAINDMQSSYGIFTEINSVEFKRVISNLINNSVEALRERDGKIRVSLHRAGNKVVVNIKDTGCGIPENILEKLGQSGVTFGKSQSTSGSGVGIYHAKRTIESFGGELKIFSKVGQGTEVQILIPISETPPWFLEKIVLSETSILVSIDDDNAIHDLWINKVKSSGHQFSKILLESFTSIDKFEAWLSNQADKIQNIIFLVDFEFLNQNKSGIELIEDLKIEKQSILVTSRYDEQFVKSRCESLKIKMIPKGIAGFVPLSFDNVFEMLDIDYILIDDDALTHLTWKINAEKKGQKCQFYYSYFDFISDQKRIDKKTEIFIDSNLGKDKTGIEIKGEIVAKNLFELGFENLYLVTGYPKDKFSNLKYIKDVFAKGPIK
ncbi:MAG: HAMP domain-containing histidine kinase [Bdellovibrionaceae bacterium]|nr:HAMP domain-containing histidine kinase [Pseudobdellovibrionaceae bacterium]